MRERDRKRTKSKLQAIQLELEHVGLTLLESPLDAGGVYCLTCVKSERATL